MQKKLLQFSKAFAILLSVFVCVWCAAVRFQSWAREEGTDALLLAAGMRVEETEKAEGRPQAPPSAKETARSQVEAEETDLGLPDDGIVPFHGEELPGVSATPDPGRASNTVEEILIDGGEQVGNFFVKDTSGSGVNLTEELKQDPAVSLKSNGEVEVLIYHTHTSEAYMPQFTGFYYTDMETRTQNQDRSVVAVGEEIKKALEAEGIGVVHDTTVNDALYNGSYSRSWEVLQNNLEKYPGIQVTIDVHRDSMTTEEGVKYKPTAVINGRKAAQIMFLAGSDANGDWGDFPDWRDNLHLALRVQQTASELSPELVRPLDFSDSKYNMNATKGSLLVEVGTEVNTASEARYSGKLVGEILAKTLKKQ